VGGRFAVDGYVGEVLRSGCAEVGKSLVLGGVDSDVVSSYNTVD
jgi:hypothetical protein